MHTRYQRRVSKLQLTLLFRVRFPSNDSTTLEKCCCWCSCCFHFCTAELLTFFFLALFNAAKLTQFTERCVFNFYSCPFKTRTFLARSCSCERNVFDSQTLDNSLIFHQITLGFARNFLRTLWLVTSEWSKRSLLNERESNPNWNSRDLRVNTAESVFIECVKITISVMCKRWMCAFVCCEVLNF